MLLLRHVASNARRTILVATAVAWLAFPSAALADRTLSVTLNGGQGRVVSEPAGIDCPTTCSATVPEAATVALTATPAPDYARWVVPWTSDPPSLCDVPFERRELCTLTIPTDRDVLVETHFRPGAQLQVGANGRGRVVATVPNPTPEETGELE